MPFQGNHKGDGNPAEGPTNHPARSLHATCTVSLAIAVQLRMDYGGSERGRTAWLVR